MSTRCMIHFTDEEGYLKANIYRHSDGYPDGESGVLTDLEKFFTAVEEQCPADTRFDDGEYLAAKYLVWQAAQAASPGRPLAFTSVAPATVDHGDVVYIYTVTCHGQGRPEVTYMNP